MRIRTVYRKIFTKKKRQLSKTVLLIVLSFFPLSNLVSQESSQEQKILVLNSYSYDQKWTKSITQAVLTEFEKDERIQIIVEFMDSKRHNSPEHYEDLYHMYKRKYSTTKFDAIITADDNAVNFALEHRATLFPGVPIIFCGVNNINLPQRDDFKNITGVLEIPEFRETIKLGLLQNPKARRIYVINEPGASGKSDREMINSIMDEFSEQAEVVWLENLSKEELKLKLSALNKESFVLLLSYFGGSQKKIFTLSEGANIVSEMSSQPVYSMWEYFLGEGILGGKLISGKVQGQMVALKAREVLSGESPESISISSNSANQFMFDNNQMERFNISSILYPPESIIINQPFSILRNYSWQIAGILSLIIILTIICLLLIIIIRAKRKVEKSLAKANNELKDMVKLRTLQLERRKKAERALSAEKEQLAITLRSIGDGVITTDIKGNIVMLNKAAEVLTGWDCQDATGKPLLEVFNIFNELTREQCTNPVETILISGEIEQLEQHIYLVAKDGNEIIISDSSSPIHDDENRIIGVVLVFRDMTENQKLDNFMQKSQKLESLGLLAGGVAHDFNNLLSGIFGYIEIAKENSTEEQVSKYLDKSLSNIDRARALTQQLITFAKGGAPIKKVEPLLPFIKETIQFALSGSSVSSKFVIQDDLWLSNFDKNQIAQVIDNLTINALHAMPDGGTIEFTAENISFKEDEHISLNAGDYVKISIKDQGIGIPQKLQLRIFDPYFTTKSAGHGLGLSSCYSIISRHGGVIDVDSEEGKGSTFCFFLPAVIADYSSDKKKQNKSHSGTGTFLVMDDEEGLRFVLKAMLESFGYTVALSKNGYEAVEYVLKQTNAKQNLAGIILDLTIPGSIGGKEAITEIRKISTDTPVFVTSGYSSDPIMANPVEYGFTGSISKPFMRSNLSELLEQNLK